MPRQSQPTIDPPRSPAAIADRIVDAILAGRLEAGQRLGEQSLADLFECSRTLVREALARLSARGMVEVSSRRGWYVVRPSRAEAKEAFDARMAIECGMLQSMSGTLPAPALQRLKQHVEQERAAIRNGEPGERSYLLGDFHVCLAECVGNLLLADILKDLTARTTLISTLFQSTHDASRSCRDHAQIVAALQAGDQALASKRLRTHIGSVANHLGSPTEDIDPLSALRVALASPVAAPASTAAIKPVRPRRLFTDLLRPLSKTRRAKPRQIQEPS
jgi:DNA-binding GntR family transcriptional regulator